jgi:aminoglycoside phosphotransferase (APT) family kinase protein
MSTPTWNADIAVDAALAARAIGEQFAELRNATVEAFGSGWDNAAFLVGGSIVFRFPRRRTAVRLIERECALLGPIAPYLPLAISAPTYVGRASDVFPWPFAGYALIAGTPASEVTLDDAARCALAAPLGNFLHALHAVETAPLVERGLPPDEIGRLDPVKRIRLARERVDSLAQAGVEDGATLVAWLETHPPQSLAAGRRTIVHGDLYARHILLDDRRGVAGVIDWGDIHLGDPALDIALAHLMLPSGAHGTFRSAYGPIDERTWSVARFRAVYHAMLEIDYGVREHDAGMRNAGIAALHLMRATIR